MAGLGIGNTIDITMTVKDDYYPIIVSHYALKSAGDAMEHDPRKWQLIAVSDSGEELAILHDQSHGYWSKRW